MDKKSFLFRISLSATCLFTIITQNPWIVAPTKAAEIKSGGEVSKSYILGPGDTLQIELFEIPELSGNFSIGPDGTIYLPRLRSLSVDGLTVDELRYFLTEQYKAFVKDPLVYIRPVSYRPVRVYVGGEITRPGYYMLSGGQILADKNNIQEQSNPVITGNKGSLLSGTLRSRMSTSDDVIRFGGDTDVTSIRWPTLFDALRAAQGVTAYSDLSQVQITRKQPLGVGGGKVRAKVDFLQLVRSGDESVNIRLFDGDVISVSRSPKVLREQLLEASRTNLSPDFIEVFVSGRVKEPGAQSLPQGATLNQAIASAGGPRLLRGGVEFLRFNPDGSTDRRQFSYNSSAGTNDYKNPVLMTGDVIRINDSLFSAGIDVLNEITGPAVGIYSVYSLFKP